MAAEKFIRVTVQLPLGVSAQAQVMPDPAHSLLGSGFPALTRAFMELGMPARIERIESTAALMLTFECPESKRDELCNALSVLIRDLVE
jgi:hypothetical protein